MSVEPNNARIELDGRAVGQGSIESEMPRDGREHTLVFTSDGFISKTIMFRDAPPPASVKLDWLAAGAPEHGASQRQRKPVAAGHGKAKSPEAEPSSKPAAAPAGPRTDNIDPWER